MRWVRVLVLFLVAVVLAFTGLLSHSEVQQVRVPHIGFLFGGSPGPTAEIKAFRRGLRDVGYIEGQTIIVVYRFAFGQVEKLPELAAELVRLKVDVIVALYTQPAQAAKQATSSIPIVFAAVADAIGAELIHNFTRPGGNITGLTSSSAELGGKRLELLKEVVPKASRVAVLFDPVDRSNVLVLKQLEESAPALGLTLQPVEIRDPTEFEAAFLAMTRGRADAMFVAGGVLTYEHEQVLVDLAAGHRMPVMWGHRLFVDAGGLMSYAVNVSDQIRKTGIYVDKILKEAKPGDLPIEQPIKGELVINLKTAKALGLTIPQSLLLRADQVIDP
jgi:putative tryptophan/tyrosine transport system substrate-binding protein